MNGVPPPSSVVQIGPCNETVLKADIDGAGSSLCLCLYMHPQLLEAGLAGRDERPMKHARTMGP